MQRKRFTTEQIIHILREPEVELARDTDFRLSAPKTQAVAEAGPVVTSSFSIAADKRLPMSGTLLRRKYKGQIYAVRVMPNGFEFEGEVYRSLSARAPLPGRSCRPTAGSWALARLPSPSTPTGRASGWGSIGACRP